MEVVVLLLSSTKIAFFPRKKSWGNSEMQGEQTAGDASPWVWGEIVGLLYFYVLGRRHEGKIRKFVMLGDQKTGKLGCLGTKIQEFWVLGDQKSGKLGCKSCESWREALSSSFNGDTNGFKKKKTPLLGWHLFNSIPADRQGEKSLPFWSLKDSQIQRSCWFSWEKAIPWRQQKIPLQRPFPAWLLLRGVKLQKKNIFVAKIFVFHKLWELGLQESIDSSKHCENSTLLEHWRILFSPRSKVSNCRKTIFAAKIFVFHKLWELGLQELFDYSKPCKNSMLLGLKSWRILFFP